MLHAGVVHLVDRSARRGHDSWRRIDRGRPRPVHLLLGRRRLLESVRADRRAPRGLRRHDRAIHLRSRRRTRRSTSQRRPGPADWSIIGSVHVGNTLDTEVFANAWRPDELPLGASDAVPVREHEAVQGLRGWAVSRLGRLAGGLRAGVDRRRDDALEHPHPAAAPRRQHRDVRIEHGLDAFVRDAREVGRDRWRVWRQARCPERGVHERQARVRVRRSTGPTTCTATRRCRRPRSGCSRTRRSAASGRAVERSPRRASSSPRRSSPVALPARPRPGGLRLLRAEHADVGSRPDDDRRPGLRRGARAARPAWRRRSSSNSLVVDGLDR